MSITTVRSSEETLSLRRVLIRNTGAQVVSQVISVGIGLVTTYVLSRHLGIEGFGQLNYILAFFYFFLSLNDFGTNVVVVREVAQQPQRADQIIGSMLQFKVAQATLCVTVAWVSIWLIGFPAPLGTGLFLYALILPLTALQLPGVAFQVALKLEYSASIVVFNRIVALFFILMVVGLGYGLLALVTVLILAEAVSLGVLLVCAWGLVQPVWHWDVPLWGRILRASLPLGLSGLLVASINRADFIILERLVGLREVGIYSAAYKITNLLEMFPLMVMGTVYPLMSRYAVDQPERLKTLFRQSMLIMASIALPIGIMVTWQAPLIIRALFGAEYVGAAVVLRILVWSSVCVYLGISAGNLLISIGRQQINLFLGVLAATVNIVLNLLLIPGWGPTGAAIATTSAYLLLFVGGTTSVYLLLWRHPMQPVSFTAETAEAPTPLFELRRGLAGALRAKADAEGF